MAFCIIEDNNRSSYSITQLYCQPAAPQQFQNQSFTAASRLYCPGKRTISSHQTVLTKVKYDPLHQHKFFFLYVKRFFLPLHIIYKLLDHMIISLGYRVILCRIFLLNTVEYSDVSAEGGLLSVQSPGLFGISNVMEKSATHLASLCQPCGNFASANVPCVIICVCRHAEMDAT